MDEERKKEIKTTLQIVAMVVITFCIIVVTPYLLELLDQKYKAANKYTFTTTDNETYTDAYCSFSKPMVICEKDGVNYLNIKTFKKQPLK